MPLPSVMQEMISKPELFLDYTLTLPFKGNDGTQYTINMELNSKNIWVEVYDEPSDKHKQLITVASGRWSWMDIEKSLKADLATTLERQKHLNEEVGSDSKLAE